MTMAERMRWIVVPLEMVERQKSGTIHVMPHDVLYFEGIEGKAVLVETGASAVDAWDNVIVTF